MKYIITIFLIIVSTETSLINITNKLKDAKLKSTHKQTFQITNDKTQYPGTKENLRKQNHDKWNEYYECLTKEQSKFEKHGALIAKGRLAYEGESTKLDCNICLSPSEIEDPSFVTWMYSGPHQNNLEPIELSEHTIVTMAKNLHVYNLGEEHTGQYVCKLGDQLGAQYFLTIVNDSVPLKLVHADEQPLPLPPWKINDNIVLDTHWNEWTPCSSCDVVGKRHKFGFCFIVLISNLNATEKINSTNVYETNTLITTDEFKSLNFDMDILRIFKYGLPCHSHILSQNIKNIPAIYNRPNEILEEFCKVKCPEDKIFVVKDKLGNIIERANNSAGIYSMLQGLPKLDPPVEKIVQYELMKNDIIIKCPGNLNSDAPIAWKIGTKNIIPKLLEEESNGRIHITMTDKINIKKVRTSDSNIFSCWQNTKLVGIVKLIVEKRLRLNLNHHVMLIGIIIIMGTFIYVFFKAFLDRKDFKE